MPEIKQDLRTKTLIVAASNSLHANMANYTCSGANDGTTAQQALNDLPASGGCLIFLDGDYNFSDLGAVSVARAIDDVVIIGQGKASRFTNNGITPIFNAGTRNGWLIANMQVDAGGVDINTATNTEIRSIWRSGLLVTVATTTGRRTVFPGQEILRLREVRHPNPAAGEPIRYFGVQEFLDAIPTFGLGIYQMLTWQNEADTNIAFGTTVYIPFNTADPPNAVEADAVVMSTRAGRMARLTVKITANTLNGNCVLTVRLNIANTAIVMTIAAGITGTFQSPIMADIETGDTFTVEVSAAGAGAGGITIKNVSMEVQ